MGKKEELLNRKVFSLSITVEALLQYAPVHLRTRIEKMSQEQLQKFIDDNIHPWANGVESGLLSNESIIYQTCMENSVGIPQVGDAVLHHAESGTNPCLCACPDMKQVEGCEECSLREVCEAFCDYSDFILDAERENGHDEFNIVV